MPYISKPSTHLKSCSVKTHSFFSRLGFSRVAFLTYTFFFINMVHLSRALAALSFSASALALPALSSRAQAASEHCGDYDYVILQDTPWIVYNMLYNANQIVGTQCTNYDQVTTSNSGTKEVIWSSVTDIEYVEST